MSEENLPPSGNGFGPGDTRETDHHACARIIHGNGSQSRGDFAKVNAEPAVVTDGSGYAARLRVLPTFGCALHEPRATDRISTSHTEEKR